LEDPFGVSFEAALLKNLQSAEKSFVDHEEASEIGGISFPGSDFVAPMHAVAKPVVPEPAAVVAVSAAEMAGDDSAVDAAAVGVPAALVPELVLGPAEPGLELVPIAYAENAESGLGLSQTRAVEPENAVRHVPEQALDVPVPEKTAQAAVHVAL
jgi:hypothetical protein